MNDSGSSILNGEALTGRPPSTPGEGPGHGTRPRAFLGDTRGDVACEVCRHHSAAQQSAAERNTRDGTHWRQQSRRTRVFTTGPRVWEGGP